jgi:hypothetical protein
MVFVPVTYCRVISGFNCSGSISAQRKSLLAATNSSRYLNLSELDPTLRQNPVSRGCRTKNQHLISDP